MTAVDIIEIVGSLLILSAFAAAQTRRLSPHSVRYLLLNIVGSTVLAVIALLHQSWGFLLLEASWAVISAVSLARLLHRDRHGGEPARRFAAAEGGKS
ncbi:CBU_0592 family membrane protein [Plantactinospora sp. WMMB782]|uniref:CBU_0592 family membrane protein n=1 Tax=Plantactinospora sp. WMMB782 TaxID=3404121 RepID=UPI003B92C782